MQLAPHTRAALTHTEQFLQIMSDDVGVTVLLHGKYLSSCYTTHHTHLTPNPSPLTPHPSPFPPKTFFARTKETVHDSLKTFLTQYVYFVVWADPILVTMTTTHVAMVYCQQRPEGT